MAIDATAAASAQPSDTRVAGLRALRALDARVLTIGHRLATANRAFCAERAWRPGFIVHTLSQYGARYRAAATAAFALDSGPSVLALAAGGPAEQAGLRADDRLRAIDGDALTAAAPTSAAGSFAEVERLIGVIEQAMADGRALLEIERDGRLNALLIVGEEGCASRFEAVPAAQLNAFADGRIVQINSAVANAVRDDQELGSVLAHELAHNILRHRERLDAAGIDRGLLQQFGRNARLTRATELEADRLSVYLMARAGYDPAAAVSYLERALRGGSEIFGIGTHPARGDRIAAIRAEIRRLQALQGTSRPLVPDFVTLPVRPIASGR